MRLYVFDKLRLNDGQIGVVTDFDAQHAIVHLVDTKDYRSVSFEEVIDLVPPEKSELNYNDNASPQAVKLGGKPLWKMDVLETMDYLRQQFQLSYSETGLSTFSFGERQPAGLREIDQLSGFAVGTDGRLMGPMRLIQPGQISLDGVMVKLHDGVTWQLTREGSGLDLPDFLLIARTPSIMQYTVVDKKNGRLVSIRPRYERLSEKDVWQLYLSVIKQISWETVFSGPRIRGYRVPGNYEEAEKVCISMAQALGWTVSQFAR